jgi:SAM-dependent methyltransferase
MHGVQLTGTGGEWARIGAVGVLPGELLCEAVDIHPGEVVVDVAAGEGAAALAAARRGADVVATDRADEGLAALASVADACGLRLRTQVADAEDLPFEDEKFDAVLSAFGATFALNQQRVADELLRVCRPAGRIGIASWPAASLMGDVLRATATCLPIPCDGVAGALGWGDEARLAELFGNRIKTLRIEARSVTLRYRTPEHVLEWLRTRFGPTRSAFDRLGEASRIALANDLVSIHQAYNRADDGTVVAPSNYLEVVAVVR